jgi:putative membrane protein
MSMSIRLYRSLQAFVLMAICLFLAAKLISGKLDLYINLRFAPLTVFAIIALVLMVYALMRYPKAQLDGSDHHEHDHEHTHSISFYALVFLLLPVLIGILIPSRPLDATAASTRGVNVSAPMVGSASQTHPFEEAADQRNILDWIRIFNSESDLTPYLGQTAHVIGFVYKYQPLAENQFLVSRFVVTCCSADAIAVGMVVNWDQTTALSDNTWVNVKGIVKPYQLDNRPVPLIEATSVESVDQPDPPYLFP